MPCSFAPRLAFHGATSQSGSARGRPSTTSSRCGPIVATGRRSSGRFNWMSPTTASSSTPPSCEPTRMRREEKGGPEQCTGAFSRWILHEDSRSHRRERPPAPRRNHARTAARVDRRRVDRQRARTREQAHRGHRLRLRRHPRVRQEGGAEAGHSSTSRSAQEASARSGRLSNALPGRGLLSQPEALSWPRHSLREDREALSGSPPRRLHQDLAQRRSPGRAT